MVYFSNTFPFEYPLKNMFHIYKKYIIWLKILYSFVKFLNKNISKFHTITNFNCNQIQRLNPLFLRPLNFVYNIVFKFTHILAFVLHTIFASFNFLFFISYLTFITTSPQVALFHFYLHRCNYNLLIFNTQHNYK